MTKSYEMTPMFSYRELIDALRAYQEIMENLAGSKDHEHTSWEEKVLSMGEAFSLLNTIEREVGMIFDMKVKEVKDGKAVEDIDRRLFDKRKNRKFAINDYLRPMLCIMRDEDRLEYFKLAKEFDYCNFEKKFFNLGDGYRTKIASHLAK